jgi:Flp pilus assembly protein protease CpaA
MIFEITFIIGLVFLLYFSYEDLKHSKLSNKPILTFFLIGIVYSFINHQFLVSLIAIAFFGGLGYLLWNKDIFGGADFKILFCVPLFFNFNGVGSMIGKSLLFLVLFLIIGVVYSFIFKMIRKNSRIMNKDKIPFVLAIALTFIALRILTN